MRYTEHHEGIAVIKDRSLLKDAMAELARYEDMEEHYITEYCPNCDRVATIIWDTEKDGLQAYCPYCGSVLMLCSMCPVRDRKESCDWREGKGCRHQKRSGMCGRTDGYERRKIRAGKRHWNINADLPEAECRWNTERAADGR